MIVVRSLALSAVGAGLIVLLLSASRGPAVRANPQVGWETLACIKQLENAVSGATDESGCTEIRFEDVPLGRSMIAFANRLEQRLLRESVPAGACAVIAPSPDTGRPGVDDCSLSSDASDPYGAAFFCMARLGLGGGRDTAGRWPRHIEVLSRKGGSLNGLVFKNVEAARRYAAEEKKIDAAYRKRGAAAGIASPPDSPVIAVGRMFARYAGFTRVERSGILGCLQPLES